MPKTPKLPADYMKLLQSHNSENEYIFDEFNGWRFFTTEELTELAKQTLDRGTQS
ncbi:MAG: hypothetical protein SFV81_14520 [Pirellulaceae bacterium]|nr:hypothetical protein [Pirellulaceae bacterium]